MLTVLDVILVIGILLFMLLGFTQGVVKVLFVIVATYLGLLLASTIYQPTASWLAPFILGAHKPETNSFDLIVFFFITLIIALLLTLFLFTSFRYAALPNSLLAVDKVGGMLLGLVLGVLVLSLVVLFLKTAGNVGGNTDATSIPVIGFAISDVRNSQVAKVLLSTRDVIRALISPLINTNNNPLFVTGLGG
jgi:uncharacterized membrane protein required for colicin V production